MASSTRDGKGANDEHQASSSARPRSLTEEDIKNQIVVPMLKRLGLRWEQLSFESFHRDPDGQGQFVDVLVRSIDGQPRFLVEVKRGRLGAWVEQAAQYALDRELPYALLVNASEGWLIDAFSRRVIRTQDDAHGAFEREVIGVAQAAQHAEQLAMGMPGFSGHIDLLRESRKCLDEQLENEVWPGDPAPKNKYAYIADLYVPRTPVDKLFEDFLESDLSVFAVVGEPGFGKTNFLCHLATCRLGDGNLVLFYPWYSLVAGGRSVRSRIPGDLGLEDTFGFLLSRLERVLPPPNKLFVLLDSVELGGLTLASELDDLVKDICGKPVRLVVTCGTFAWSRFVRQPEATWLRPFAKSVFHVSSRVQPEADLRAREHGNPVDIQPFEPEEFAEAWVRYSGVYGLPAAPNEDLVPKLRNPLRLRMFCEGFDDAPLSQGFSPFKLFSKYVEKQIPDVKTHQFACQLANRMVKQDEPKLPVDDSVNRSQLQTLEAKSIVVIDDAGFLRFREDGVLECLISERLVSQLRAAGASGAGERLDALAATRSPNVLAAAVEALATLDDDEALVAVCLEYLASLKNDEWKYCCCAVLRALPRLSRAYDRVIHMIAQDRDFRLRRFLVDCVADRYSPEARRDLVDVFAKATNHWEFRETIAAILEREYDFR